MKQIVWSGLAFLSLASCSEATEDAAEELSVEEEVFAICEGKGRCGIIDAKGDQITPNIYDVIWSFNGKLVAVFSDNNKYGLINRTGEIIIPAMYSYINHESVGSDMISVKIDGKYGVINLANEFIIQPTHEYIGDFSENGLALFEKNDLWGWIDQSGSVVIEPIFQNAGGFSDDGTASVLQGGKWGRIDSSGKFVIEAMYDREFDFAANGLATVKIGNRRGFIDRAGRTVIDFNFDGSRDFGENGLAPVWVDEKVGFIDSVGEFVIRPQYDNAFPFSKNGLAAVEVGDKWGFINKSGSFVIKPTFDDHIFQYGYAFQDSNFAVVVMDGKMGIIDESGSFIVNPIFSSASVNSDYFGVNIGTTRIPILHDGTVIGFSREELQVYAEEYWEEQDAKERREKEEATAAALEEGQAGVTQPNRDASSAPTQPRGRTCSDHVSFSFDGPGADNSPQITMSGPSGTYRSGGSGSLVFFASNGGCIGGTYRFSYTNNANWVGGGTPDMQTHNGSFRISNDAKSCSISPQYSMATC